MSLIAVSACAAPAVAVATALCGDVVPLDLVDQGRARDTELGRRAGAVADVVFKRPLDVLALEIVEAERRMPPVADAGPGAELAGEMLDTHLRIAARQDERA